MALIVFTQTERIDCLMVVVTDKQKRALILEYEEVLIGKKKQFSSHYFTGNSQRDCEIAVEAFRYFFNSILMWDIETVEKNFSIDLIKKYKLDKYLMNYIIFENEPNDRPRFVKKELVKADVQQLLKLMYGKKYKIDLRAMVIETYEDVLNNRIQKFPKMFFSAASEGRAKACICLQHAIDLQNTFGSIEDLYSMFADRNILKLLSLWRLKDIAELFYDYPIDYLHEALPDNLKDDDFYKFYYDKYMDVLKESGRTF